MRCHPRWGLRPTTAGECARELVPVACSYRPRLHRGETGKCGPSLVRRLRSDSGATAAYSSTAWRIRIQRVATSFKGRRDDQRGPRALDHARLYATQLRSNGFCKGTLRLWFCAAPLLGERVCRGVQWPPVRPVRARIWLYHFAHCFARLYPSSVQADLRPIWPSKKGCASHRGGARDAHQQLAHTVWPGERCNGPPRWSSAS